MSTKRPPRHAALGTTPATGAQTNRPDDAPAPPREPEPASPSGAAEGHFRALFEQATIGIAQVGLDGRIQLANPRLGDFLGYHPAELAGRRLEDLAYPDDRAAARESLGRLLAGEPGTRALELRHLRKDGALVWGHLTVSLIRGPGGTPLAIGAVFEDITARKALEDRLRRAEREATTHARRLAAILDAIADGVFVYDARGDIVHANAAVRRLLAFDSQPDFAARPLPERLAAIDMRDDRGRRVPPERSPQRRVLRGEVLAGADARDYGLRVLDGRRVVVNATGGPVRDEAGKIGGGVLILRDVTERRRLERRTRESLSALLEMAETLVQAPPADGHAPPSPESGPGEAGAVARRLAELTCAVLGCERASIAAVEPATDLMRPMTLVGFTPRQERLWWAGWRPDTTLSGRIGLEAAARLRANECYVLDATRPPHRQRLQGLGVHRMLLVPAQIGGQLTGALALSFAGHGPDYGPDELALAAAVAKLVGLVIERERLLREREEARASALALREANRRMDEFLSVASHELKTPVTTIKVSLQMLARRLRQEEKRAAASAESLRDALGWISEIVARSGKGLDRLTRLVDDLLDVSRIRAGKLELDRVPCDLATVVREAIEEQRQIHPARAIRLEKPAPASVPLVADADRLGQVVTNYLTNALKYSPADRPVAVRLSVDGGEARVAVRDEGPGVPEPERPHIWELFHRVPGIKVQSGSGIGLGLGLYISKTIVELHDGRVSLDCPPGGGSIFSFAVPLDA